MARKDSKPRLAQVKIRLPELLRRHLEREAARGGRSMNAEIIKRLGESLRVPDQTALVAEAVYKGLDDFVLEKVVEMYLRSRAEDDLADAMREEEQHEEMMREEGQVEEGSK
jgi:Arc-like DNA binding domain